MPPRPALLIDELVEEVLFRLPPDEPAWLVRASAVCKPWGCIFADPGFRRRYRDFHGTPPILGFFDRNTFVPTSAILPAKPKRTWDPSSVPRALDCRHGRALFTTMGVAPRTFDFTVLDPLTSYYCNVPFRVDRRFSFSAGVLCATQGCDHHDCQRGHFLVAVVATNHEQSLTSGWLYSSETRVWSELTTLHHPGVKCKSHFAHPSVLIGDELYFNTDGIIQCQLGTLRLSMFEKPIDCDGRLMKVEDGGLAFATVVNDTDLILWSTHTGHDGAVGWAKLRVIDLKTLLPDGALSIITLKCGISLQPRASVSGIAEGTQTIFVSGCFGSYMVDLKSGRARQVCDRDEKILIPYMAFYIPAMEAASPAQGLAFATVVNDTDLIMWSTDTGHDGVVGWTKIRVIDLKTLLPDGALPILTFLYGISMESRPSVSGIAEGTQVIFVSSCVGSYMVDLKSGRARQVCDHDTKLLIPYMAFYIPGITYLHI